MKRILNLTLSVLCLHASAAAFVPLSCNNNYSDCVDWTEQFGDVEYFFGRMVIPCGECVVMNQLNYALHLEKGLDVYGKLIIPDGISVELRTSLLVVHGELIVHSTKPVDGSPDVRVIMTDQSDTFFVPINENGNECNGRCNAGRKAIIVAGGKITVRGIPRDTPTWLPLLAAQDDSSITVDAKVANKWAVGAEILITSHMRRMDQHQQRKITAITLLDGKATLHLNASIDIPTTFEESQDFAAEVALLSRNILFEDDGLSNTTSIGGHFIVMETPNVVQHIEGLEIVRFGQQGVLGKYPIHMHFCDDANQSLILRNSIRQSLQRCIVLHGTDNTIVEENVAFDVKGHCFILEDGVERHNTFVRNLGALISRPKRIIPGETDSMASVFWITNPLNTWIGNVAAGAQGSGYWFELFKRGPKADLIAVEPSKERLLRFEGNVAHSILGISLRTYPSGFEPAQAAEIRNFKSFRNSQGMFFHRSSNIHVLHSVLADNKVGIDIDRADDIVLKNSTFIGQSDSYRKILERKRLDRHVCSSSHVGLEIHTHRDKLSNGGLTVKDCSFKGYAHIPCEDAVPVQMDDKTKTGTFDLFTTFENVSFEPGTDRIDFCVAAEAGINDVFLTDLDGSLKFPFADDQEFATAISNHRNMFEFIDSDACEVYEDRCYQYCPGTCFRTTRFEIDPAETSNFFLRVCRMENTDSCIFVQGRVHADAPEDSARYLRVFVAHLPKGRFLATFVNGIGTPKWPSFVDLSYEYEACDSEFAIGDVSIEIPFSVDQCSHMIRNGKFDLSDTKPSYWLQRDGGELQIVQGTDGSNAMSGVKSSARLTISQFLDNRCLSAGTWFRVRANIQVMEGSTPIVCDPEQRRCPQIGLHTQTGGFQVIATTDPLLFSDEFNVDGYVQIDRETARAGAVSFYVASRQRRQIIVDDVFMYRIDDPGSFCQNLIRGFTVNRDSWRGLWKTTKSSKATLETVSSGVYSPTALLFSKRTKRNDGLRYDGFRNIDLQCILPGSQWLISADFWLVDKNTGEAASCDPSKAHLCPSIRLVMWDKSGKRIVQKTITEYRHSEWDSSGYNQFRTNYVFPSETDWDGSVGSLLFDIVGFPPNLDLIFDQVLMMRL